MALDPTDKRKQFWWQYFVIVYVFIYPTRLYNPVKCFLVGFEYITVTTYWRLHV